MRTGIFFGVHDGHSEKDFAIATNHVNKEALLWTVSRAFVSIIKWGPLPRTTTHGMIREPQSSSLWTAFM